MKKFNTLTAVMAAAIFILSSCGGSTEKSTSNSEVESDTSQTSSEAVETTETPLLLNANWATKEELLSVSGITEEVADRIIAGRPIAGISQLNKLLSASLNEEVISDIYNSLFVPLNLNTASEEEIKMIPGVGDKMAHEFDEYRPYAKMAQFKREIGKYVDDNEVERLAMYVFVPVELNTATEEEFLSIPGVGDKMAHEFDEYRPYENMEQFRREIGKYVSQDVVAMYERYVYISE